MNRSASMTTIPRRRARGSGRIPSLAATLALTLGLALLLACAGAGDDGVDVGDRDLLELVPGDVSMLVWTDLAGLRATTPEGGLPFPPFTGKPDSPFPGDLDREKVAELKEKTGIDLERDVHQVALGLTGDPSGKRPKPSEVGLIAALRVDYDGDRLAGYLEGQPTLEYRGHTLHRLPAEDVRELFDDEDDDGDEGGEADAEPEGGEEGAQEPEAGDPGAGEEQAPDEERAPGDETAGAAEDQEEDLDPEERLYLVMLDREALLVGTRESLESSLDLAAGEGVSLRAAPEKSDLLERAPSERLVMVMVASEAFSRGVAEGIPQESPVPRKALASLRGVVLTGHVDSQRLSTVTLLGLADTEENARLLKESAQGMLALGKMMLQQQHPELFEIVDRVVTVEQDDTGVRLQARITEEDGETLQKFAQEQMGDRLPKADEGTETETG